MSHAQAEQRTAKRSSSEAELVARLRAGDERAFERLVEDLYPTMLAVARAHVRTRAIAEEVVQDTWLGVLKGLDRFEGRSSLKTWIMQIVVHTAMRRGTREARSVPFASLVREGEDTAAVEPERFRGAADAFPGHWRAYPADWRSLPEQALMGREAIGVIKRTIEALPVAQRTVITLRDIQGCDADEVCAALELSAGNQRVLLHRARSRVRAALEAQLDV